ncbi:deoxyribonuclease V [Sediminicurvatus halobius]|uniref:Endonuclease V n=1 Tax=Sediminicurvatus halobius TaxID=2182432 RepID=A0A2U2N2A3_9GAMM|nr:deoxyribonuclease V [Spiribacter halobius]PWG63119.1 deoxyribonuclease V [Spiribacter halobius]UEX77568.1 deoxyribonuclease V [Spiribacter halobius]
MNATTEWPTDPAEARALQTRLARKVRLGPAPESVQLIAGVDTGFADAGRTARAAVVVMRWPGLEPVAEMVAERPTPMPYVPGLLSFRELPAVLDALERLAMTPDLVLCDGQGIAHPRRLGIAAHLGVITGFATIGVGKSRLVGTHAEPDIGKGAWAPLMDGAERIGTVLRTRAGVRPLWVSPGHRVDHDGAADWVLACCRRYRLPEPIRAADRLASRRP